MDGVYYESIEKLAGISHIEKLKKAYELLQDKNEWSKQLKDIEEKSPQLAELIKNNQEL